MINQLINDQQQLQATLHQSDCERPMLGQVKKFPLNSELKIITSNQIDQCNKSKPNLNFSVERLLCNDKILGDKNAVRQSEINHQDKHIIRPMALRYLPTNPSSIPEKGKSNYCVVSSQYGQPKPESNIFFRSFVNRKLYTPSAYDIRQDLYKYSHPPQFSHSFGPLRHNLHEFNAIHSTNHTENYTDSMGISSSISIAATASTSSLSSSAIAGNGKRKRSWSRAVFSQLQRKGLEIQFQIQKYITKPDRRKLAARLGLTDAQVKVWFQNRRMKWRHSRDAKFLVNKKLKIRVAKNLDGTSGDEGGDDLCSDSGTSNASTDDDDEIDVVTE